MAFTYFFRDMQTLKMIPEHVIPQFQGRAAFRIWDAGCAVGAEPFSLAIVLREELGPIVFKRTWIYATDLDPNDQFGKTLRQGVYPEEQVRRIPDDLRHQYFTPGDDAAHVRIVDEVKARVNFQRHDLLSLASPFDHPIEAVVCKNVLLHFSETQRCDVIRMFHHALTPGGFLAMEHTQPLPNGVTRLFERVTQHARLYRKAA